MLLLAWILTGVITVLGALKLRRAGSHDAACRRTNTFILSKLHTRCSGFLLWLDRCSPLFKPETIAAVAYGICVVHRDLIPESQ